MIEEKVSTQYEGFQAEFYDIMQADLSDIPIYLDLTKRLGSPILEIGSGTGRVLLPLTQNGHRVVGVEPASDMNEILHQKAKAANLDFQILEESAENFSTTERFPWAFIACNTLQIFLEENQREQVIENIAKHLLPEGHLLIDLCTPDLDFMKSIEGKKNLFEFFHPISGNLIVNEVTAHYDFEKRLETNLVTLKELDGAKCVRTSQTTSQLTYFFPEDIKSLLAKKDFEIEAFWGDYDKSPFDDSSEHMLFLAKKRD